MKAVDGDRGINNPIIYSITGGPGHLFGVNRDTGTVFAKSSIDREGEEARNGAFILEVTAGEVVGGGGQGETVSTEVTVIVEVSRPRPNVLVTKKC